MRVHSENDIALLSRAGREYEKPIRDARHHLGVAESARVSMFLDILKSEYCYGCLAASMKKDRYPHEWTLEDGSSEPGCSCSYISEYWQGASAVEKALEGCALLMTSEGRPAF